MVRRLLFVGDTADVERIASKHRLVPGSSYVFGQYAEIDELPEAALLWEDLRHCYRMARLTAKQRYAHQEYIKLVPLETIAERMGISKQAAHIHVQAAIKKLDGLGTGGLGCWTTFIEITGGLGWSAVRERIAEIEEQGG